MKVKVSFLLIVLLVGCGCAGMQTPTPPVAIPQLPLRLASPYWKAGVFLEHQCWAEIKFDKPVVVLDRVVPTQDAGPQLIFKEIKKIVLGPQQERTLVCRDLGEYYGTVIFYRRSKQTGMPTKQGIVKVFALKDEIETKSFCIYLDGKHTKEYRGEYYGDILILRP